MSVLLETDHYEYPGYHDISSFCKLTVARQFNDAGRVLVLFTQPDAPSGTSITNSSEHLATSVARRHRFNPDTAIFLERYPHRAVKTLPEFQRVEYTWENDEATRPQWSPLDLQYAHVLLREYGIEP